MNFYQAVFPEKNFLENIHKKAGFYPLIFTLFGQSCGYKKYYLKSRLLIYATKLWSFKEI